MATQDHNLNFPSVPQAGELCGFCGEHLASPSYTMSVELHGTPRFRNDSTIHANMNEECEEIDRKWVNHIETSNGEYEWDCLSLAIPRCKLCKYRNLALVGLFFGLSLACLYLGSLVAPGFGISKESDAARLGALIFFFIWVASVYPCFCNIAIS
jgi:hypothetical protein